uniref:Uncharacterized protein n=1 Tax=Parastrongyloides trichosuri TaxID=131310 RepID=A0A0N4ZAW4_PARTI
MCFENSSYIGIFISDVMKELSEDDRNFAAEKYASFADFFHNICPNAKILSITNCETDEGISFDVESIAIQSGIEKYGSLDKFGEALKEIFNYKNINEGRNEEEKDAYNEFRDKFLETVISVFPSSVQLLLFHRARKLGNIVFDKIAVQSPNLETISFVLTFEIPYNCFTKLKKLRNIVIHGESKVIILEWI